MIFDIDDADDALAHMRCVRSLEMALALLNIQELLRADDFPETLANKVRDCWIELGIEPGELTR